MKLKKKFSKLKFFNILYVLSFWCRKKEPKKDCAANSLHAHRAARVARILARPPKLLLKSFVAVIFAANFFICNFAQASIQPFEIENEEIPELDPEYKEIPTYEDDEKPPETEIPAVENEGLEFLVYHENGVMAFAIIADHEKYQLRPILAKNQIKGRATVSQMSKNLYDIAIINASYFMPSGSLIGVTKIDGEIIGVDDFYRSAIGIYDDGTTIFGRVRYSGEIEFYGNTIQIGGVNCERGENSLVLYNGYFGETTGTNNFGVEIAVEGGVITDIFHDAGNNFIPPGGYIISAHGTAAEFFKFAQIGDLININQQILSDDGNFNDVPNVIGAGPRLVMDGKIFVTAAEEKFPNDIKIGRAPRSAVGVTSYGDYILAVVDGRQAHSKGCTLQEWADILLNKFGRRRLCRIDCQRQFGKQAERRARKNGR